MSPIECGSRAPSPAPVSVIVGFLTRRLLHSAAIDNERRLYELLSANQHDHILPVYGICTDAPDGKVRLVMKYSAKGSLSDYLTGTAKPGGWLS
jgi:hypothetical protein